MQIDKDTIVNCLKEQGRQDDANKAANELPDQVDHAKQKDLLARFGIDPSELLAKLSGGLGDSLGGMFDKK